MRGFLSGLSHVGAGFMRECELGAVGTRLRLSLREILPSVLSYRAHLLMICTLGRPGVTRYLALLMWGKDGVFVNYEEACFGDSEQLFWLRDNRALDRSGNASSNGMV